MIHVLLRLMSIGMVYAIRMDQFLNFFNFSSKGTQHFTAMQHERARQIQAEQLEDQLISLARGYALEYPDDEWPVLWNMAKLSYKRTKEKSGDLSSEELRRQVLQAGSNVETLLGVESDVESGIAVKDHIDIKNELQERFPNADEATRDYAFGCLRNLPAGSDRELFERQLNEWANDGFFGPDYGVAQSREVNRILNKLREEVDLSMLSAEHRGSVEQLITSLQAKFAEGQKWTDSPTAVMHQARNVSEEFMKLLTVGVSPSTSQNLCLPASIAQWAVNTGWESKGEVQRAAAQIQLYESKQRVVAQLHADPVTRLLMKDADDFAPSDAAVVQLFIHDLLTDRTAHKTTDRIAVHFLARHDDRYEIERTVYVNEGNPGEQLHNCYILWHKSHYSILRPTCSDHPFYVDPAELDAFKDELSEKAAEQQAASAHVQLALQFEDFRDLFGEHADAFKEDLMTNSATQERFTQALQQPQEAQRSKLVEEMAAEFSRARDPLFHRSSSAFPASPVRQEPSLEEMMFGFVFEEFERSGHSQPLRRQGLLGEFREHCLGSRANMQKFQIAWDSAAQPLNPSHAKLQEMVSTYVEHA